MLKIKKGDKVKIIAGKNSGEESVVLSVLPSVNKVIVENVNMVTRHIKPDAQAMKKGERIKKESPIDISNVMLICPKTKKPTRVGFKIKEDGTKVRIAKISGEEI